MVFTVQWYLSVLIMHFKNKIWKDKLVFSNSFIKNYLKRHKRNSIHSLFNTLYQWLHHLSLVIDRLSEPLLQPELREQNKQKEGKELGISRVPRSLCLSGPSVPYAFCLRGPFPSVHQCTLLLPTFWTRNKANHFLLKRALLK